MKEINGKHLIQYNFLLEAFYLKHFLFFRHKSPLHKLIFCGIASNTMTWF